MKTNEIIDAIELLISITLNDLNLRWYVMKPEILNFMVSMIHDVVDFLVGRFNFEHKLFKR